MGMGTSQEGTWWGDGTLAHPYQCPPWGVCGWGGPRGTCPETPARSPQGTNYRKTNPALEIHRTKRDSFWAQAEVRGRGHGGGHE